MGLNSTEDTCNLYFIIMSKRKADSNKSSVVKKTAQSKHVDAKVQLERYSSGRVPQFLIGIRLKRKHSRKILKAF